VVAQPAVMRARVHRLISQAGVLIGTIRIPHAPAFRRAVLCFGELRGLNDLPTTAQPLISLRRANMQEFLLQLLPNSRPVVSEVLAGIENY
jgi:hypothetical protein